MSADTTPAPVPPRYRWRRRAAWAIGALVLLVVLLFVAAGGGVWWALRSDGGTAWLLSRIPGLQIQGGKGTLWGDFEAARIEFALPGGGRVVLTNAGWRGLRVEHAPWVAYKARVVMDELHAQRVDVELATGGKKEPARPPQSLRFPVELDIGAVQAAEVHLAALGETPLRDVRARLHLGAEHGTLHRVDTLALAWGAMQAAGSARIAADPPYAVAVQAHVSQPAAGKAPPWQADASLDGPLEQPVLAARVRVPPDGARPEQALDVRAGLRPFAPWPLGELQARTQALDISALVPAAPVTALTGEADAQTSGLDQPATLHLRLANAAAGRWNEGRLPVRQLVAEARARPDDPRTIDVTQLAAELGGAGAGGRLEAHGRWTPAAWSIEATLQGLQPSQLDARAPDMLLGGPLKAAGRDFDRGIEQAGIDLQADLAGRYAQTGPARAATLKIDVAASTSRIEVREARAAAGGAQATLSGLAQHRAADAPWQVQGRATLVDFDPAPWWPGREGTPWRRGPNRLNAKADFDVAVPVAGAHASALERLDTLRGHARVAIERSVLAGVALQGQASLDSAGPTGAGLAAAIKLDAAGNRIDAEGRLGTRGGAADAWKFTLAAPALEKLAPLWRLGPSPDGEDALAGALNGEATLSGRWPALATQGHLDASTLRIGRTNVQRAQARWQVDAKSGSDAALDVQATATQISFSQALFKGMPPIESVQAQVQGSMRAHRIALRGETKAQPPAWTDAFQPPPPPAAAGTATSTPAPQARSVALLDATGGALPATRGAGVPWAGWRGHLQQLELRSTAPRTVPWVGTRDVDLEVHWADGPLRVAVQPGRADVLGAALRWDRIAWQAAAGGRPAQVEAQAELEPLTLSPLLGRLQPGFGWGGDLAVVGHARVRSAPSFTADIVLERQRGDLTVTDETGNTQPLGLTDLRLGLDVQNGTWSFTQGLAGTTLGIAAGAFVARTSPQATWPTSDTPVQGVLEVQVANLGTWGPWLPPGWRLTGALRTSAGIGGRFGAPEYTGEMRGSGIGVRNFLLGVNVTDGDVDIALRGTTARIERFSAHGGTGTVKLDGNATFGAEPKALVKLQADHFQLLGRVDRRIVTSGQAQLQLEAKTIVLDGKFAVDEGLIDFTRSDAPSLSSDVVVARRTGPAPAEEVEGTPTANPAPDHEIKLNVDVALGERLRLKGRGLDTGLRGDLHITSPGNQLALNGTVRAVDGTYAAYGQKLTIDRGLILFNGPAENPRLDIEATRPNLDVRVGVVVSGTALNPRVRLFSEPEMTEIDKLSWLVLGRGGDTLGRTDTALLQRAAMALLAGEGESQSDQFTKALGLDELSLRQSDGEVHETIVSLGKQISRRWYVGYERSLNATAGSWQLIYRIAQRFTLRAQAGADSSVDLIWTWRWQ
jgi:translocation and assembly module TamB